MARGPPAWPSGQPSSYAVFNVAALEGWTQLDNLGSHTIGQGDGYVWSSNVNDPEGREFHVVVASDTNYPTVVSNGQPVDINGIAGTAGEGEVSWPLDAAHTAVVTEFGTTDVERAVALARQLTTTTVSSLSSQQPAGSVADAVTDVAAQFAGSVDGMAWSLAAAPDGVTIIVDGIVREFREVSTTPHPASRSSRRETTITVCSSPPTCPPAAMHRAWRCPTAPSSRFPLARWTRCPARLRRAFLTRWTLCASSWSMVRDLSLVSTTWPRRTSARPAAACRR